MSETVRIYINAKPIEIAASATALDAVEALDATQAASIRRGERLITDSRGIVTANDTRLHNGAIFRIVRARQASDDETDSNQP
ncbi:MAG: hypothetical protein QOH22_125 [Gemmatimonadaceae bacterium]|jgi:hypothetical protein|nr:hypothetical protein [Gemmatimonadaceae bacterium]MEA2764281.1 hypothetical protein [Gemmatimonadaceae bacterium]